MPGDDLSRIHGVMMYSASGSLIISQYYTKSIPQEKRLTFENAVFQRAVEDPAGEVMQHDEFIVVYKPINDLFIFVVCDLKGNELLMGEVAECIQSAMMLVFKGKVNTETLVRQIDLLYLVLDETIENGYVFEGDCEIVAARAMLKEDGAYAGKSMKGQFV